MHSDTERSPHDSSSANAEVNDGPNVIPPPGAKFPRYRRPIAVLVLVVATASGVAIAMRGMGKPKRFAEVAPGILMRSGQPTPKQVEYLVKNKGLRTIVIARSDKSTSVPEEAESARALGVNVVTVPIGSRSPVADEQVTQFFECVDNPANHPILVHCAAGRHRTGYLCALYRIERQGWSKEKAIDEMLSFGFDQTDHEKVLKQLQDYVPIRDRGK